MADGLLDRVLAWAERYDMLPPPGGALLCAVSGGADSVCLLLMMCRAAREKGFSVFCAHYNHLLRGEESARDADFVRELCRRLDVHCVVGCGDVRARAAEMGKGIEETAREMRYAFLRETVDALGAARIATAHNMNDNAETMLLNLARGAGSAGLAGIAPARSGLVRPLLCLTRSEIERWLLEQGETWVTDSSNLLDEYARNRLRHEALPALESVNPAFVQHALDAARRLRADDAYLTELAENFLREKAETLSGCTALPVEALSRLPEPIFFRVLKKLGGQAITEGHAQDVRGLLHEGGSGKCVSLPGMKVCRSFGKLCFGVPEALPPLPVRCLDAPGAIKIPECGIVIRRTDGVPGKINKSFKKFYFEMTKGCGRITIRPKIPGDRLRLPGRGCSKSLKALFAEAEIPAWERSRIPVLADENGLLAVVGFGADERRLAASGEPAVLIEIIEIKERD